MRSSTTVVWLLLSAITVVSWWLGPAHQSGTVEPSTLLTLVVVALGVIKSRLIIRYFMEVRTAPRWLRLTTDGWVVALWGVVVAIYLW